MSERDMSEQDTQHSIGKTLTDGWGKRDAIHIAVAPVVAVEALSPGQPIGFAQAGNTESVCAADVDIRAVGIVDPFVTARLFPGQRFWMFLMPNTIKSLRHQWTHPDWESAAPTSSKDASEAWLRKFCAESDCPSYETVIAAASSRAISVVDPIYGSNPYENDGEYLFFSGRDAHGPIPPEFWTHVEIVTGVKIQDDKRASSFSCSC